jgi:hypothetical protein
VEDLGRHRIGISQNQPHINAHVAPQLYNGTDGLLQENARRMVALPVLNYHVFRHRVNANVIGRGWKICTKKWPKYACKYALKREKICIYICIYALKYAVNWSFSLITHDKNQNSFLLFIYLHMFIYKLKRNY